MAPRMLCPNLESALVASFPVVEALELAEAALSALLALVEEAPALELMALDALEEVMDIEELIDIEELAAAPVILLIELTMEELDPEALEEALPEHAAEVGRFVTPAPLQRLAANS